MLFLCQKNIFAAYLVNAIVKNCYDGDTCTVLLNNNISRKIRLMGIDAPELPRGRQLGQFYAYESTMYLNQAIKSKTVQLLVFNKDRYQRLLTEIYLDNRNINIEMLTTGNAEVYKGKNNKQINIDQYLEYEKFAKNKHLGIWHNQNYISPYYYRKINKNHLNGK